MNRPSYISFVKATFFLFCILHLHVHSQTGMSLKENDLDRSPNLSIGGNFVGVDIYTPNLAFIAEAKLCYRLKNELGWLRLNYTIGYLDRIEANGNTTDYGETVNVGGTEPMRNIGGHVGVNFIKRFPIRIARGRFLNSRRNDIKIPVKFCRLYGAHVGYEMFRSVLASGSTTSYTGTIVKDYNRDTIVNISHATPMMRMTMLSVGIHRQFIEHYVLQVKGSDNVTEIKGKSSTIIFADFIFSPNLAIDNILVPFNERAPNADPIEAHNNNRGFNYYEVDVNAGQKKIPFGGRIGVEQIGLGPVGFMMGTEFGFRPGYGSPFENIYILAKVGMSFNMRAK